MGRITVCNLATAMIRVAMQFQTLSINRFYIQVYPEFIDRAKLLGERLIQAMDTPYDKVKWLGEESWCPVCHSNLMMQSKPHWDDTSYEIECAI